MKKIFLVFMLSAAVHAVQAQSSFGIHANGIMANAKQETDGEEDADTKYRFSWKAGLVASVPLTEQLSFMPQLNVLSKGYKVNQSETFGFEGQDVTVSLKADAKLTYIELPLNFVYHANTAEEGFFVGIGPSVSYGIGGKLNYDANFGGFGSFSDDIKAKFDGKKNEGSTQNPDDLPEEIHLKAFEFGGNILAGYRLSSGLFVQANYNHGFSNISPDEGTKIKNRYFGLGIGYFLGGK